MMDEYFQFLRGLYFFKDLSDDDVGYIGGYCHKETIPAGSIIFNENDAADKFYIIRSGAIEVWKNYGLSDAVRISIQGRGHVFGEMALVDDMPRSATVLAQDETELIHILHAEFEHIMRSRTSITMSILRSLSSIVRNSNEVFMQHLAQQNLALERAYVDLKSAQDKLITNERLSNLGKFASFILHDLRNPIAAIRGYAEMVVLEDEQQAALTQYAKKIVQEADHVNRFANDILDYSRGQIRLVYKLITVESLLAKLRVYTQEAMWRRNIAFEVVNSANQEIYVDEDRILRALINIVDNARKACSVGGRVSVTAEIELSNLLLTVSDNGEGMADEVLANIFEPFYSSSKQGGTGLGMLIVKSIVEAHGGHVAISSKLGVGTKIVLIIPVKP